MWEERFDVEGLDKCFPLIGEIPKCSETLVCKLKRHFLINIFFSLFYLWLFLKHYLGL